VRAIPRWLRQSAILVAVYAVGLMIASAWMPWHEWDMGLYARSSASASGLDPNIALVDIAPHGDQDPSPQDEMIATFFTALVRSGQHPSAVYVDFAFLPCQSASCSTAHRHIATALDAAERKPSEIAVFGVVRLPTDDENNPTGPLVTPAPDIYDGGHYTGVGHTDVFVNNHGVLSYRPCYPNVVYSVSGDIERTEPLYSILEAGANKPACDQKPRPILVGPRVANSDPSLYTTIPRDAPAYFRVEPAHPFPQGADFTNRYVIVGTTEHDNPLQDLSEYQPAAASAWQKLHGDGALGLSGPELLAWELNGKLEPARIAPAGSLLIFLVPAFGALTALAFVAAFFFLRRLRLGKARAYVSWIAAGVALGVSLAIFGGLELLLSALNGTQPQVSLTTFSIALSAVLSGVRGSQIMASTPVTNTDDVPDYDVFISYAHLDEKWVRDNVVKPFQQTKLPNGKPLLVFFDRDSLVAGDNWRPALTRAVLNSALVVPIYSSNYFREEERGYCRFELECAFNKWIQTGDKTYLRPIMFGNPAIPPEFGQLQAAAIELQPGIVQRLIADVIERSASVPAP